MNYIRLTKRENQIMDILWDYNQEMSANDIKLASNGLSIYTIQQVLQHLLSIGYIEVAGIGKNNKSITRLYKPIISESEYVSSYIKKDTFAQLAANYIQNNDNLDAINDLEKLIQKKKKELAGK